jgi:hypothetical protein
MNHVARVFLSVLALCAAGLATEQRSALRTPIDLTLTPYVGRLRTIGVSAGNETAAFLLDTGGGLTVLMPEVARTAGCVPFGRVTGFRSSGERFDFPRCGPVTLKLGPQSVRTEAVILDLAPLLKGAPAIAGIVSLHTLRGGAFTLDLTGNRLTLETSASLARRIKGVPELSIRTSRQAGGAALDLFLEVRATPGSIWLEVDSGNAGPTLMSPHALSQLGASLSAEGPQPLALDVRGIGLVTTDAVAKDLIYDGLLNAAFLESIVLTVDLSSERAWAVRRRAGHPY